MRSSCRQIQDAARPKAVHLLHFNFSLGENTRGCISEQSGNVEGPGALLTLKQIFGGNAKVGAGLFAGEIELYTCCVAMVKLLERVVELLTVVVLLTGPNLHLPS